MYIVHSTHVLCTMYNVHMCVYIVTVYFCTVYEYEYAHVLKSPDAGSSSVNDWYK